MKHKTLLWECWSPNVLRSTLLLSPTPGTGTNAAYIENVKNVETFQGSTKDPHVVINMEWGAFGEDGALEPFRNEFDRQLDKESLNPGKQM